jgi:hypothetical protein
MTQEKSPRSKSPGAQFTMNAKHKGGFAQSSYPQHNGVLRTETTDSCSCCGAGYYKEGQLPNDGWGAMQKAREKAAQMMDSTS